MPRRKSFLEAQVERYKIPPFTCGVAMFEHILVYRIPADHEKSETFLEGGKIVKAETRLALDQNTTPRGVLVSAGLRALDILRSDGSMLGDVVWIAPDVYTRYDLGGREKEFTFCNVGDIITNETKADRLFHHEEGQDPDMDIVWSPKLKRHVIRDNTRAEVIEPTAEPTHHNDEA